MQTAPAETTEIEVEPGCVADWFWPLLTNRDRYLLLWGGRDSTKSDGIALKLLLDCINLPYFKCLMLRKIADTVAGSQWATLKAVAEREGIDHLFFFGVSPCVIKCLENGNVFLARGLDKPKKLKSTKDPTCAWFEEGNEATAADAEVVSTTLRTSRPGAVIQEIYTFNPDHDGNYKEFWLYKKFFSDTGHADDLSFRGSLDTELDGETISLPYTVAHATIRDNPWAPKERIAKYKGYGDINPQTNEPFDAYRYRIWYQGLWATKETGNEFYHKFSRAQHVKPTPYLPEFPIWTSWDANSLPYSAMLCGQLERTDTKLVIRCFAEYAIGPPESGVRPTARKFLQDRLAKGWQQSIRATGDASMRNRKPGEGNATLFKDIEAELVAGRAASSMLMDFWLKQNPNVDRRRDFLNKVLSGFYPDIKMQIDPSCVHLIADLEQVQKGIEGKLKVRSLDKELNVSYEKLGHFSDVWDYLLITLLPDRWQAFVKGYGQ